MENLCFCDGGSSVLMLTKQTSSSIPNRAWMWSVCVFLSGAWESFPTKELSDSYNGKAFMYWIPCAYRAGRWWQIRHLFIGICRRLSFPRRPLSHTFQQTLQRQKKRGDTYQPKWCNAIKKKTEDSICNEKLFQSIISLQRDLGFYGWKSWKLRKCMIFFSLYCDIFVWYVVQYSILYSKQYRRVCDLLLLCISTLCVDIVCVVSVLWMYVRESDVCVSVCVCRCWYAS